MEPKNRYKKYNNFDFAKYLKEVDEERDRQMNDGYSFDETTEFEVVSKRHAISDSCLRRRYTEWNDLGKPESFIFHDKRFVPT